MNEHQNEQVEDPQLVALARAVVAGTPIDWTVEESRARTDELRAMIRELRVISGVSDLHRSLSDATSSAVATPAPVPDTSAIDPFPPWGPLRLVERVGRGSFGDVFRAWDTRLDREVALKLLRRHEADDAGLVSTVIGEGRLLARVRHPNVVTVHGADRIQGEVGLWMEFIHGRTLEELLRQQGHLSAQEAMTVGIDVCRALSAVHHAGLLHRDIKAQNVMREDGGRVVLMDFGAGRDMSDQAAPSLSGTPLYIAPEIFAGGAATIQSDIYSVGILLYHLVSGSYPARGSSIAELADAHVHRRRRLLRDVRPDLPSQFISVVDRALADIPTRFASAGELEAALGEALSTLHGSSNGRMATAAVAVPAKPPPVRLRRYAVIAVATGTAALLLAFGFDRGGLRSRLATVGFFRVGNGGPATDAAVQADLQTRRIQFPDAMHTGRPSPDGRVLSFVAPDGNLAIFDLETGETRRLTNKGQSAESGESQMAISHDGRWIAYTWSALDGAYELRVMQTDGKWPRVLLRRNAIDFPMPIEWSRDGTKLLALLETRTDGNQIALISVEDGSVHVIRTLRGSLPRQLSLSSDGEFVVYDRPAESESHQRDIFVARVSDGREDSLVEHPANDVSAFWSPDATRIIFSSDRAGSLGLWEMPVSNGRAAGAVVSLHRDLGRFNPLGLTDTGSLYYMLQTGMVDVYTAALDATHRRIGMPAPVSSSFVGSNNSSSWSADGRSLAYVSMRGYVDNDRFSRVLVIRDAATGAERILRPALAFFIVPRWSPDGRTIMVRGTDLTGRTGNHFIDTLTGGVRPALLGVGGTRAETSVGNVAWSPAGDALWYDRVRVGLFARDRASGAETKLFDYSGEGLTSLIPQPEGFRISPDGQTLAFYGTLRDDPAVSVLKVKTLTGNSHELLRLTRPEVFTSLAWTADGSALFFGRLRLNQPPTSLWWISVGGGEPYATGFSAKGLRGIDVRSDGKSITYTAGAATYELWRMDNLLTHPR